MKYISCEFYLSIKAEILPNSFHVNFQVRYIEKCILNKYL